MEDIKGRSGLKIIALVLLAFLFAYRGMYTELLLLLGFALLVERNEVLSFQITQVLFLRVVYDAVLAAWSVIYRVIMDLFDLVDAKRDTIHSLQDFNDTLANILWYAFVVLLVLGIIKVLSSKNGKIPVVGSLAKKLFD